MDGIFATDLTDEETRLGFVRAFVPDPAAGYNRHGSIVAAVVYRIRDGEWLIKLSTAEYSHQIFGRYADTLGREAAPVWLPVSGPYTSAELAINGHDGTLTEQPKIQGSTPTIALRCPKCSAEFRV